MIENNSEMITAQDPGNTSWVTEKRALSIHMVGKLKNSKDEKYGKETSPKRHVITKNRCQNRQSEDNRIQQNNSCQLINDLSSVGIQ